MRSFFLRPIISVGTLNSQDINIATIYNEQKLHATDTGVQCGIC